MRTLFLLALGILPLCLFGQFGLTNSYNYATNPVGNNSPYEPNSPNEKINFVLPTSDGGYLLVGQYLWGVDDWDFIIRKVNASGQSTAVSISNPGSASEEIAYSAVEYNGFYYVTGSYSYYENNNFVAVDCFLGKYDANLNLDDWTSYFFPGYEHFVGTSIIEINGELVIGGTAKSSNATTYPNPPPTEGAIFRVSPTTLGVLEVETNLGTGVFKLENSTDGNFYVFGEYFNVNNSSCQNVYDGPYFIVTIGDIDYYGGYYSDVFVRKFTASFNNAPGWNGFNIIGGDTPDAYVDAIATPDGGFAILGFTDCESQFGNSGPNNICESSGAFRPFWLYKGTSGGNFHWNRSIQGGIGGDFGPFGIVNSCVDGAIILGEQYTAFVDYVTTWSSVTSTQTTGLGTFTVKGLGSDIKRGLNGEIVVGGWYFANNQDLGFYRYSSENCANICDNLISITCNSPYNGNNSAATNLQSTYACTDANQFSFLAGEQVFRYFHSSNADFEVTLTSSNIDHDIFLFDDCNNALSNCLGVSLNGVNGGINSESIQVQNAPTGFYYIVVDGQFASTEGPYTLTVNCCSTPVEYDDCGALTYSYNNFNLNYTFSAAQLNDFAQNTDWRINGNPITPATNSNQLTYSFPGDGSYTVCAPYINQNGCIDYCCETYCIKELDSCLRGLILPCDLVCECTEGSNTPLPDPFQCESFESYAENDAISTSSSFWTKAQGALDGIVQAEDGENQVLRIAEDDEETPSINYNFYNGEGDNLTCGRYRISWDQYVPTGQTASFRFLYEKDSGFSTSNTAAIFQLNGDGTATIDAGEGVYSFSYDNDVWENIMFIIDLDREQLEFWLNHDLVYVNEYSTAVDNDSFNFDWGAINFYGDQSADYLIDNICVRVTEDVDCGNVSDPICSESGQQYDNSCLATNRGLYTALELQACLNICNYSATNIGRSDDLALNGFLNAYEQVPPSFYTDQEISNILESFFEQETYPLYADYYIFENEENGQIELVHDESLIGLVFQCVCDESGCSSPLIGTTATIPSIEDLSEGLYYIALVGPAPNTSYNLTIFPESPCVVETTVLNCDTLLEDQDFSNAFSQFSNPAANNPCYQGINTYALADKVYRLEISAASTVDITLDANGGAAGLFLYNYACGTGCIDYAETSNFGGIATIADAPLGQGIYYLLVDQQTEVSSFSLNIECEADNVNTFLMFDGSGMLCPTDPGVSHEVRLNLDYINDPELGPTDVFSLQIRPPASQDITNDLNPGLYALVNNAAGDELVFPLLEQYMGSTPAERCSYLLGDSISVVLERNNQIRILEPVFATDADLPQVNASSTFQEGGQSAIIGYQIANAGLNLYLPENYITFGAEDQLATNRLIGIIGENETTWNITPEDTYEWLTINVMGGEPYTGLRILSLSVDPNNDPGYSSREAFLLFQTTSPPFITRRIRILQRERCVPPEVTLIAPGHTEPFAICDNESITLQALTAGPDSLYRFFWNNETLSTGPTRFVPNLPSGANSYSVTVQQLGCEADFADALITVYTTPPQPTLNATTLSSCGEEATFTVTDPAGFATYTWYNAAGDQEWIGTSFTPTESGMYFVEAANNQDNSCTSPSTSINYTNIDLQANNTSQDNVVCLGETIQLSVNTNISSGDLDYHWSNGITANAASVSYTPTVAGPQTITVNVSLGECEANPVDIPIQVTAIPGSPMVDNTVDCVDNPNSSLAVLTPNPDLTYDWFTSPTIGDPVHTGPFYQAPATLGTTSYWVSATVGECASERTQVTYSVIEDFTVTLTADQMSICEDETVLLGTAIVGNMNNLTYAWSPNVLDQGEQATFTPTVAQTETITVEVSNGPCSETVSIDLTVDAQPSFDSDPLDVPEVNCAENLETYQFSFSTDGLVMNTADLPVTPVIDGQNYLMTGIPAGQDFDLIISNGECIDSYPVFAPTCACAGFIDPPTAPITTITNCSDEPATALVVEIEDPEEFTARWYDGPGTGATLLAEGLSLPDPTPGTYYVETVNLTNNCASDALAITYDEVESFDLALTADQESICLDEMIQLSTTITGNMDNLTYSWSNNVTDQGTEAIFDPISAGSFTVEVEAANGPCSEQATVTLNVDAPPSFGSDPLIVPDSNCDESLQSYSFEFNTDGSILNLADLPVMPEINGQNYLLADIPTGQDFELIIGNGECVDTYTITSPLCACTQQIELVSSSDPTIVLCDGDPVPDLVVGVANENEFTAYWYDGPAAEAELVFEGLVLSDPDPGDYYVETVSLINGCSSDGRLLVSLTIADEIDLAVTSSLSTACYNELVTLSTNASGGATPGDYTYEWSNGLGQSSTVSVPASLGTQAYFVTVTDQDNICQNVGVVSFEGIAYPDYEILAEDCLEEDAYTVDFSTDATDINTSLGSGIIIDLGDNNYRVIIPIGNNLEIYLSNESAGAACELAPISIISPVDCSCINANIPLVEPMNEDGITAICADESSGTLEVMTPPDGMVVEWYSSSELLPDSFLEEGTSLDVTEAGNYYAVIYDPAGDCRSNFPTTLTLVIHDLPDVDAGLDDLICFSASTTLMGSGNGVGALDYLWESTVALSDNTILMPSVQPLEGDNLFSLQVTDSNGCANTDQVVLTGMPPVNSGIEVLQEVLCAGESSGQLAATHQSAFTPVTYLWSNNETTDSILDVPAGDYSMTVTDSENCSESSQVSLGEPPALEIGGVFGAPIIIDVEGTTPGNLSVAVSGGVPPYSFSWTDQNGNVYGLDSIFVTDTSRLYQVNVTDQNGCSESLDINLIVNNDEMDRAEGTIRMYPNPTKAELNLQFDLPSSQSVLIRIFDGIGQSVQEQQLSDIQKQVVPFDLQALPAGVYWIVVQTNKGRFTEQILKMD